MPLNKIRETEEFAEIVEISILVFIYASQNKLNFRKRFFCFRISTNLAILSINTPIEMPFLCKFVEIFKKC